MSSSREISVRGLDTWKLLVVPANLGNLLVANYISLTELQSFFDRYFETGTENRQRRSFYRNCVAWKRSGRSRILSLKEFLFGDVWSTGTISIYDAKWTRNFLCANRSYRRETDRTSLFPQRIFSSFSLPGGNVMRKQDKLRSRTAIEASSIQTKAQKRIAPLFFHETIVVGYLSSYFSTKRKPWREKNFNEDPSIDMIIGLARRSRGRRA